MENLQSKVRGGGTPTKSFQIAHLKKKQKKKLTKLLKTNLRIKNNVIIPAI